MRPHYHSECDESFDTAEELDQHYHQTVKHRRNKNGRYICHNCTDKSFYSARKYEFHIAITGLHLP